MNNKKYNAKEIQSIYQDEMKGFTRDLETGEVFLLKTCLIVTHRCTLKCKLCAERTAYYQKRYHPELAFLREEIDRYFELVHYTMKFDVSGGEPFLRLDLHQIMEHLLQYRKQFGRVRINTNGTLLPSDALIDVLKAYDMQADILIDHYGDELSKKAMEIAEKLEKNNISYILRRQDAAHLHCGGWVDFGDLTKKHTVEEAKELFAKCAISNKIGFGFRMKEGVMSPCAVSAQCVEFGKTAPDPNEYVDLFDETIGLEDKRRKLEAIFNLKSLKACRYCNGMCVDSIRYVPAEQL